MSTPHSGKTQSATFAATRAARATAIELLESRLLLSSGTTTVRWNNRNVQAAPGEWVVRVANVGGKSVDETRTRLQGLLRKRRSDLTVLKIDPTTGIALVKAPSTLRPTVVSRAIAGVKGFKSIAPNYTYSIADAPNDPNFFPGQWPLFNVGQPVEGVPGSGGADIKAFPAWDLTHGDGNVVVAVLDTGVQYTHPDLAANIWTNPGEISGNGIDDDDDGFVDDVHGYDFANSDANPDDDHGHGTHVAGIIGAVGNNNLGITGVAWNTKILPVKMLDQEGFTTSYQAIQAVNYVTHLRRDMGINVRVINASWSGTTYDAGLQAAISDAGDAGILFVAAAGNSGSPGPEYPAAFGLPNEISVAATDNQDRLAPFSNFGPTVQIAAPGVGILSTVPTAGSISDPSGYGLSSGTSMAAPHVAGVAVLAFSLSGSGGDVADIRNAIISTADINFQNPIMIGQGGFGSGGRLNAYAALNQIGLRVIGSSPGDGALITDAPPTSFDIYFSQLIDANTLQPSDLTVNGVPANSVSLNTSFGTVATFTYSTTPVTVTGDQIMAIAEGAVSRSSDGGAVHAWSTTFRYGGPSFDVVSADPAAGSSVPLPMTTLRLRFTTPLYNPSLNVSDLLLSTGTVTGVAPVDLYTVEYTLSGITAEGTLSVHLPAGAVSDSTGRPNTDFTTTYHLTRPNDALAASLLPVAPLGSTIYRGATNDAIGAGADADRFPIVLDAGQTLDATVRPTTATLRPTVSVLDDNGTVIGSATAAAPGASVVVPVVAAPSTGTYTVVVGSADTSAASAGGAYSIDVALNAAYEAEGRGGTANDARAAAQDIDVAFTAPDNVRRAGVMGSLPASSAVGVTAQDWFAVTLSAGESPTIAGVLQTAGGSLRLNVYNAAGTLLVGGSAWNNGQAITGFTAPSAGTYYIRASGTGGDYAIVVTDGAFDLEPNNTPAAATNLGGRRSSSGYVSGTSASVFREIEKNDDGIPGLSLTDLALANDLSGTFGQLNGQDSLYYAQIFGSISAGNDGDWDFYRFQAQPGDSATIEMDALGGGALNPYLRLVDNTGKLIASDDDSAGNQSDARMTYGGFAYSGDYYVIADSFANATQPDYTLSVRLTTPNIQRTLGPDDYRMTLAEGQTIEVRTATPGDGPGATVNTLDPSIEIRGVDGNVAATDTNGAPDGRNAMLTYTAPYSGSYTISVLAAGTTRGEYVLNITDPAPALGAPGAPRLAAVSDTGLLSDDNITRLNNSGGVPLQYDVPGTTPGATVMLFADGNPDAIGSAIASGTTTTILTSGVTPMWEGLHYLLARQTPAGGGAPSGDSARTSLTIDTTAPAPPSAAPDLRDRSDTGLSATDNITSDVSPTFDFAIPAGSYFSLSRNGAPVAGTFGPGSSYTSPELDDGEYDFAVATTDLAGNQSALSSPLHVTIDATAPAAPGALDLQAASDSGILNDDDLTNVVNPTFDVTGLSAGSFARVYRGIIQVSAAYAGAPVTTNVRQPDGTWGYFARAVDAAGNLSDAGPALNVTIDTLAWSPAVSGALDPTFGGTGKVLKAFSPFGEQLNDMLLLPDNKILAAGFIADIDGIERFALSRFNADGSLDPTFGTAGLQTTTLLAASKIGHVLLQADGKILVSGSAYQLASSTMRGEASIVVARYSADGAPDLSFGNNGAAIVSIGGGGTSGNPIALQLDDKILVGGNPVGDFGVVRLNIDGSIDTTFGLTGKVQTDLYDASDDLKSLIVQPDGGILAVGTGTRFNDSTGGQVIDLVRYLSDGSLDPSFGDAGRRTVSFGHADQAYKAVMAADGKIVIAGAHEVGTSTDSMLLRLNADGTVDTTFGAGGLATANVYGGSDNFTSLAIQADGNIVTSGGANLDTTVARFLPNGTLDASFGNGGKLMTSVTNSADGANAVVVQRDGKIVLGGYGTSVDVNGNSYQDSALVRFGNAPEQAPPTLDPASDDGTPGDGVTTQTSLAFQLQPQDPFFNFFRDDQQIAGGYQAGTAYTAVSQPAGTHAYGFKAIDRAGNASALSRTTTITINAVTASASVVERRLFYNNSKFDAASDDAAIATDKVPLLPGGGRATLANVSSYDKGINGIMLDLNGLPAGPGPSAADFDVAVSTDGTTWTAGPAPTSVTTRRQQGTAQSDRVTLFWPDNSIRNQWVRLTAKVTNATGLSAADVSYFGSAVGETGNFAAGALSATVDAADYYAVRDHLRSYDNPAPVTWNWDVNRDGVTDATDLLLVRTNATASSNALQLISPPQTLVAGKAESSAEPASPADPATTMPTESSKPPSALPHIVGRRPASRALFGSRRP